jgi:hypothetical protein
VALADKSPWEAEYENIEIYLKICEFWYENCLVTSKWYEEVAIWELCEYHCHIYLHKFTFVWKYVKKWENDIISNFDRLIVYSKYTAFVQKSRRVF